MPLALGPVLRHVGETTASVWVQTDEPATVSVLGCSARTFEVAGHHYALVPVTGLEPDSTVPYTVEIDGERAWPPPAHPFPPSVIRTRGAASRSRHRIIFGSCRYPKVGDRKLSALLGVDALDAYAARMATRPAHEWPDALLLLGDQIYADELTLRNRLRIASRHDRHPEWPDDEIVGYDEYVGLYHDTWSDPEIRWLMSTVPTAMIFDDHDVRDDWNTSAAWRADMAEKPWWRDRVRSALASYWVYQHIGNIPVEDLAADADYRKVLEHDGDAWPLLVDLADRADTETDGTKGVRFSFSWDLGHSRLLVIDSRNGRILEDGSHLMLSDAEFSWIEQQSAAPGRVDHLLIGTSVPWLLPHAIGDLESVNEIAAGRPGWRGRLAEAVRQVGDLEHWAAFRASFDRLTAMIDRAAGSGPASVSVLSGDVHHSYVARAVFTHPAGSAGLPSPGFTHPAGSAGLPSPELPDHPAARVYQLTCSPVHNKIQWFVRPGFRLGWSRATRWFTERWARRAGAPPLLVSWQRIAGPMFGNTIATLDIDGQHADVLFERPRSSAALEELARLDLTG